MEECLAQSQTMASEKVGSVVLDIDSLAQHSEKCSGSPKMTKALSRKGSCRSERRNEEQEADDASKKLFVKVLSSQVDPLKQPLISKTSVMVNSSAIIPNLADPDGRSKRFSRLTTIHPRKILLFFATMSSMGTMVLIYFTLAINRRVGS